MDVFFFFFGKIGEYIVVFVDAFSWHLIVNLRVVKKFFFHFFLGRGGGFSFLNDTSIKRPDVLISSTVFCSIRFFFFSKLCFWCFWFRIKNKGVFFSLDTEIVGERYREVDLSLSLILTFTDQYFRRSPLDQSKLFSS